MENSDFRINHSYKKSVYDFVINDLTDFCISCVLGYVFITSYFNLNVKNNNILEVEENGKI